MPENKENVTLSICMIVRNEEAVLERCLETVKGVYDQLVIVDTGSEDMTMSIARRYTEEVYSEPWENNFGKARNSSYSHAVCDYIMYIDADDVLPPEEREKLLRLKKDLAAMPENVRPRTILMQYDVPEAGGISYRQRMVARHSGLYWYGAIHECMHYEEPVLETDILFLHRKEVLPPKDRNCNIIRSIPREELKKNFWLSAQCFLDMMLAGHNDEAEEYFTMCADSSERRSETYLQLASTLNHHKLWDAALRWVKLAEHDCFSDKELHILLLQQGVKACVGLDMTEEAIKYNNMVLELAPDNRAAKINRIFFEKKQKGK